MATTFDKLYKRWIDKVTKATSKDDYIFPSSALRNIAAKELIHYLDFDIGQKRAWEKYYQLESQKIRTGKSRKSQDVLDRKTSAIRGNTKVSFYDAVELKKQILIDLGQDPTDFHVGHKEHGPAMDKARILFDHAKIVDEPSEVGITIEQKEMIRKVILAQQQIERAKHTDIVRIQKQVGIIPGSKPNDTVLLKFLSDINEEVKLNADFLIQTRPGGPELTYGVELEGKASNSDSGELTKLLGIKLNKIVRISNKRTMEQFKKTEFARTLMNVPGSLTLLNRVGRYLTDIILGNKRKEPDSKHTRKTTLKAKAHMSLKAKINQLIKAKKEAIARIRRTKIVEPKVPIVGLFNVMGLINFILGNEIRAQMGQSSDPPSRLRYQSGRFADSASLIALKESTARVTSGTASPPLIGIYTYLHYPYDVFLPGHPLDNGLRDPTVYIEHGIRAAARTILQERYPGMVLEPD